MTSSSDQEHDHISREQFEDLMETSSWVRQIFGKRIGGPVSPSHLIDWSNRKVVRTDTLPDPDPEYVCVSHVWGRLESNTPHASSSLLGLAGCPTESVEVSGEKLSLTKTFMENAGLDGKMVWMDLACLPQQPSRKHKEVPFMGKYFYHAQEVLCWVEQDTVDSLRDLMVEEKLITEARAKITTITKDAFKAFAARGMSVDNALLFRDIITDTPWFGRVWTLQEMLLPKVAWLVSINGDRVLMSDLGRLAIVAIRALGKAKITDAGHLNDLVYTSADAEPSPFSCMSMCAVDVIRAAQRRGCRFEEDRLYGVLGLLPVSGPIEVVYGDVTRATDIVLSAILRSGDLSLIGLIGTHTSPLMRPLITNGAWYACDCTRANRSHVGSDFEYHDGALAIARAMLSNITLVSPKTYTVTNLTMERVFARTQFDGICYSPLAGKISGVKTCKIAELTDAHKNDILQICNEEFGDLEGADAGITNVHSGSMRVVWIHLLKGIGFVEASVKLDDPEVQVLVPPTWQTSRGGVSALVCVKAKDGDEEEDVRVSRIGSCITDFRLIANAGRRASLLNMKRVVVG
ncbi:hypothetical protein BJ742DRAFT_779039 [Cladochytrium replicatum]|nr:hypothetical protein BJ742DRAFT_779039 [Cladochytrium replicatum]